MNKKNFKYELRIEGTRNQLVPIREKLLELGYVENRANSLDRFDLDERIFTLTQFMKRHGRPSLDHFSSGSGGEIVVSADNPDLVLALAAMVNDIQLHKGEIVWNNEKNDFHRVAEVSPCGRIFRSDLAFNPNARGGLYYATIESSHSPGFQTRKATKEEIFELFKNKTPMNETTKTVEGTVSEPSWTSARVAFIREAHGAACSTWKERIEAEFPELFFKVTIGDRFKVKTSDQRIYIVAHVELERVALISLKDGNRYREPVSVGNPHDISTAEQAAIGLNDFDLSSKHRG